METVKWVEENITENRLLEVMCDLKYSLNTTIYNLSHKETYAHEHKIDEIKQFCREDLKILDEDYEEFVELYKQFKRLISK